MFMELLDIMNERFSVKKYVDKPVEPEKLDKILNAAHAAPGCQSAACKNCLSYWGRKVLKKPRKTNPNIYGAPVAVIVCA